MVGTVNANLTQSSTFFTTLWIQTFVYIEILQQALLIETL